MQKIPNIHCFQLINVEIWVKKRSLSLLLLAALEQLDLYNVSFV